MITTLAGCGVRTSAALASNRADLQRGISLLQSGRLQDARVPLLAATRNPALAAEAHFFLAADYFESAEYAQALSQCKQVPGSLYPERLLYIVEESNRRSGHLDEAKQAFHNLFSHYPDSAWTHLLLANAYEDQQRFDDAISEYKLALQKDPLVPNANFAIGYIYWRQQQWSDASEWLNKQAALGCHALANFYLGEIARTQQDWVTAEKDYRRAIGCDATNPEAHLRLGMVLADQKRYAPALLELQKAEHLQPSDATAHYQLASVYTRLGRKAAAEAEYAKVRQIKASKDTGLPVTQESR